MFVAVAISGLLAVGLVVAVPGAAGAASAGPTWETVELGSGESQTMTSGLGDITLQVGPGSKPDRRILQLTLRLGPDATYYATWGAAVSGAVKINGNYTGWTYNKAAQAADYDFHSSLDKYQNEWDAPWTSHRLHSGDFVEIAYTALIPNVDRSTMEVNYRTSVLVR